MVEKRKGVKFETAIPNEAGYTVGMTEFNGQIILACQYRIYQLSKGDDTFKKIKFEMDQEEK